MGRMSMTSIYVLDTHALFWHLTHSVCLSDPARQVFDIARSGAALLVISPIVLLELYALLNKVKAPIDFAAELQRFQAIPYYRIEAITLDDLLLLDRLQDIPEMHDRVIAATAVRLNATVLTRDPAIQNCASVKSIW